MPLYRFTCTQKIQHWVVICLALLTAPASALEQQDFDNRAERTMRQHDYDVMHYRIELVLDEDRKSIDGVTTITLVSTVEALREIVLDAETFRVISVRDVNGEQLVFSHSDGELRVGLNTPLRHAAQMKIVVEYQGENVDVDPTQFGMSAGYDLGLDFKAMSVTNPQLINTLSFPEGARHWFPSFDHPSDWASHETIVTVREDYEVAANGALVSVTSDTEAGTRTFHWNQEKPQPTYLYVLAAGPYSILEDQHGDLPLHYWVYPGKENDARTTFRDTKKMLAFYEERYGVAYPWVKYDQIAVPGISGGAESTSASILGDRLVRNKRELEDFPSTRVIAHEIVHQWWGDYVGYRDWTDVWLAESFATFGEYLYQAYDLGADEGAYNLDGKKRGYLTEAETRFMRPIVTNKWDQPNHMFDRHAYQKGAVVLNMFRDMIGDDVFRAISKRFLQENGYNNAVTQDYFDAVLAETGEDYSWFFDQWLMRPGHPVLDISHEWDEAQKQLLVTVQQKQDRSNGTALFRLPIKIGVTTPSGKKVKSVWLERERQTYAIDADAKPLMVHFDEGDVLLKEWSFEKPLAALTYQLRHDGVMGRIWAAEELEKFVGQPAAAASLQAAAAGDDFWGVRLSAVRSLNAFDNVEAAAFLKARAVKDNKPHVREAALEALADDDDATLKTFFIKRAKKEKSDRARAVAVRALGGYADPSLKSFFENAIATARPRSPVIGAAEEALLKLEADQ